MSDELIQNDIETEKDLPSEVLTHIAATYPFLTKVEYYEYMQKATNIDADDPIQEITKLVELLDNPHATFRKKNLKWNPDEHETNPEKLPSGELIDNVLYLKIPTLSRISFEDLEKVFLPSSENSIGLILDLRDNGGGSEIPARRFAEKFFIKPGKHTVGTNVELAPEGGLKHIIVPADSTAKNLYNKPIVILISNKTLSSAERFIAIMKAGSACTLIGTETGGGSANPVQTEIEYEGQKYTLSIPTWRFFLEGENRPLEETKIIPDIEYKNDDIVQYAVNYILETSREEH